MDATIGVAHAYTFNFHTNIMVHSSFARHLRYHRSRHPYVYGAQDGELYAKEDLRNDKTYTESESIKIKTPVSKSIVSVLEPKIEQWIANKGFCKANLSIKDVALELGTNHNYLSKYLNNNLNVSFQVWLNTLRVVESKQILLSENISIEEVGIKVGIPQSYNFSRWFRIVTGETPFKYRQHLTSRVS